MRNLSPCCMLRKMCHHLRWLKSNECALRTTGSGNKAINYWGLWTQYITDWFSSQLAVLSWIPMPRVPCVTVLDTKPKPTLLPKKGKTSTSFYYDWGIPFRFTPKLSEVDWLGFGFALILTFTGPSYQTRKIIKLLQHARLDWSQLKYQNHFNH